MKNRKKMQHYGHILFQKQLMMLKRSLQSCWKNKEVIE